MAWMVTATNSVSLVENDNQGHNTNLQLRMITKDFDQAAAYFKPELLQGGTDTIHISKSLGITSFPNDWFQTELQFVYAFFIETERCQDNYWCICKNIKEIEEEMLRIGIDKVEYYEVEFGKIYEPCVRAVLKPITRIIT